MTDAATRRTTARRAGAGTHPKPGARQVLPPGSIQLGRRQRRSIARSTAKVNLWHGSIRSGKTLVSWLRFLTAVAMWKGGGSIVIIGKSRDSVFRNIFEPIERDPWLAWLRPAVSYRQGAASARILGLKVAVLGANDAGAYAKIRGMTVGLAYGDELSVWAESMFTELLGRMSPPGATLFCTTNPDNPGHWLHKWILEWEAGKQPEWTVFHFTMEDNPGLTPEYRDFIGRQYVGLWHKRMILGLWVAAEGAIFADWDEGRHTIPWDQLPKLQRILAVAVDFGVSHATSAVLLGVTDEYDAQGRPTPRLIALDEWRHDSTKDGAARLAASAQVAHMWRWLNGPHTPAAVAGSQDDLFPEFVFRDPAAADLGEEWQVHTGSVMFGADNDVLPGISDVANLLHQGRLVVVKPTGEGGHGCAGVIEEAPGYVWDAKASAKGNDVPVKERDDSLDALRYAVRSTRNLWLPIMQAAYGLAA